MGTAQAHFNRGRMFGVKGRYKEAIDEYKRALEIDPHYVLARNNLRLLCYINGITEPYLPQATNTRKIRRKGKWESAAQKKRS